VLQVDPDADTGTVFACISDLQIEFSYCYCYPDSYCSSMGSLQSMNDGMDELQESWKQQ